MESFTFRELYRNDANRKSMGVDIGVLDQGIYYLVAIISKDLIESKVININKRRRDFLKDMHLATIGNTLYQYLLENIVETSCSIKSWQKWVKKFIREYQRNMDVIISSEMECVDDIIAYYPELLECIRGVDEEENYLDKTQITKTFSIGEMLPAVTRFISQSQEGCFQKQQSEHQEISKSYIREV